MAKPMKKLKMLLVGEEKTQADICNYLREQGFDHYSNGYVSLRMTNKACWTSEEMYALAEWLSIPDEEILSYFPRRQIAKKKELKVI